MGGEVQGWTQSSQSRRVQGPQGNRPVQLQGGSSLGGGGSSCKSPRSLGARLTSTPGSPFLG